MVRRVALALILGGLLALRAEAQTVPATTPTAPPASAPSKQVLSDSPPPLPTPAALPARAVKEHRQEPAAPAQVPAARVPVAAAEVRDPLSARGRFANPGGVGRYSEYYTPFTPMVGVQAPPTHAATFGRGGALSRAEQIETFRAGQYRTQNIQNNINAYGRPVGFGIGYGYGRYGGFR